jgi:hypothetical protein
MRYEDHFPPGWSSYRKEAHEIEADEKVHALSEAVEADGQRGAVQVVAGQQGTSK